MYTLVDIAHAPTYSPMSSILYAVAQIAYCCILGTGRCIARLIFEQCNIILVICISAISYL